LLFLIFLAARDRPAALMISDACTRLNFFALPEACESLRRSCRKMLYQNHWL